MANSKISDLTALLGADVAADDLLPIVDVSDHTQSASGTSKRITRDEFIIALAASYATAAQGSLADSAVQPGDIGTAAAQNVGYFATAAQGSLADSAVQPGDIGTAAAQNVGYFATAAQGSLADSAVQPGDIGTAAAQNVGYFATAAQGSLADSAVQPGDIGTAAAQNVGYFATAAQGSLADSAVQPGDDAADLGSAAVTDGYVLTADGAGGAAWEAVPASGITDVVQDTTPQLGGNLDINGYRITGNAGTLTTDQKVLDLSVTWNNAAVTFTGWKLNVTDTTSNAASLLVDLQVGGVSKFKVSKSGEITAANILNVATSFYVSQYSTVNLNSTGKLGWTGGNASGAADTVLARDAANTLAQRNGTNAQTFRLYNTYTDASNHERASFTWNGNVCYLKPENAGTGTARLFVPVTGAVTVANLPAAATAGIGARAFVTDALGPAFGAAVVGGGAVKIPVYSDGAGWFVG